MELQTNLITVIIGSLLVGLFLTATVFAFIILELLLQRWKGIRLSKDGFVRDENPIKETKPASEQENTSHDWLNDLHNSPTTNSSKD